MDNDCVLEVSLLWNIIKKKKKKKSVKLRLFRCKIFSITICFQMKMIFFFSVFGCILENALENILQYCAKYRAEGVGGEACVFGKWFTKKLGVNYFSNFNKGFSGQQKLFSV
jgi:hypothetical protein